MQSHLVERRAVIDIGTNSVKLLVADVRGREVAPVTEVSEQTRLGRGFYANLRLQPDAIAATARAVGEFTATARKLEAAGIRMIATSAARDARNADELRHAVETASGLPLEVISGESEADLAFQGVTSDPALAGHSLLIMDVGGGSTEFILGSGGHQSWRQSFPLGTVRLLEHQPLADLPGAAGLAACRETIRAFLDEKVRPVLDPARQGQGGGAGDVILVGTGGTTAIMARIAHGMEDYDRAVIESTRFSRDQVTRLLERLWGLPLAGRRSVPGLPANRADVILFGLAIFEVVMSRFELGELRVSTRGLRYGAVLDVSIP